MKAYYSFIFAVVLHLVVLGAIYFYSLPAEFHKEKLTIISLNESIEIQSRKGKKYKDEEGKRAALSDSKKSIESISNAIKSAVKSTEEEISISVSPKVLLEVKPLYPKLAKINQLEGSVILNVYINEFGDVERVEKIEGNIIFESAAIIAMKKIKFSPLLINGKATSTNIRYTIVFKLE
jgi:TonB family protein